MGYRLRHISFVIVALVVLAGCTAAPPSVPDSTLEKCLDNCTRPVWCDNPGEYSTDTHKAFCGVSFRQPAEALGRQNARLDAQKQAVDDMGLYAKRRIREAIASQGSAQDVMDAAVAMIEQTKVSVEGAALGSVSEYHTQTWENTKTGERYYRIYARYLVPRAAVKEYAESLLADAREKSKQETVKELLGICRDALEDMKAEDW